MADLEVVQIPVLSDNYVYLVHDEHSGTTGVVDPAVESPVVEALEDRGWTLDWVINTHHHGDHTGANLALKKRYGCRIVGPRADARRIPGIDEEVGEGDTFSFGGHEARVFDVPGHTRGHIAYWFAEDEALFCGDTLFSLGCGRLFEGTPEQMWSSLLKLRDLSPRARVYCAHEYTEKNAEFSVTVDPHNPKLEAYRDRVRQLRSQGTSTVPSLLKDEREVSPFLRADDPALKQSMGMVSASDVEVFAEIRRRRDRF